MWTVFAAPAAGCTELFDAVQSATEKRGHLIVGEPLPGRDGEVICFTVDRSAPGDLVELWDDRDGKLAAHLRPTIRGLWSLTGSRHDGEVILEQPDGRLTRGPMRADDGSPGRVARLCVDFDLMGLFRWAGFGLTTDSPAGTRFPLDGAGEASLLDRARVAVETGAEGALALVRQGVATESIPAPLGARWLARLGAVDEALQVARQTTGAQTWRGRAALLDIALAADRASEAAELLDLGDQLPRASRARLLRALGREDQARRELFEADMGNLEILEKSIEAATEAATPEARIEALSGLRFVSADETPGHDLIRRAEIALQRRQLGEPPDPTLVGELRAAGAVPNVARRLKRLTSEQSDRVSLLRAVVDDAGSDEARAAAEAELGLLLHERGDQDAGTVLESAYLNLGTSSPLRGRVEQALTELGLF